MANNKEIKLCILPEYLLPDDDVPKQVITNTQEKSQKEKRQQLKMDRIRKQTNAIKLCSRIAIGEKCENPTCRFSHDIVSFLKQKQTFSGDRKQCVFSEKGCRCPFGVRCVLSDSHVRITHLDKKDSEEQQSDLSQSNPTFPSENQKIESNSELKIEFLDKDLPFPPAEMNTLSAKTVDALHRFKYDFPISKQVIIPPMTKRQEALRAEKNQDNSRIQNKEQAIIQKENANKEDSERKEETEKMDIESEQKKSPKRLLSTNEIEKSHQSDKENEGEDEKMNDEKDVEIDKADGSDLKETAIESKRLREDSSSAPVASSHVGAIIEPDPLPHFDYTQPSLLHQLTRPSFSLDHQLYLAPLTTLGNLPFRSVCKELGCDMTCSEMVVAAQVLKATNSELSLLHRHPSEGRFGVQIAANHIDQVARCVELLNKECLEETSTSAGFLEGGGKGEDGRKEKEIQRDATENRRNGRGGGIDFFDLNCGCPVDQFCHKGLCCGLMARPTKMAIVAQTMSLTAYLTNQSLLSKIPIFSLGFASRQNFASSSASASASSSGDSQSLTSTFSSFFDSSYSHFTDILSFHQPMIVKMRIGVDEKHAIASSLFGSLADWGMDGGVIHGRTKEQRYTKTSDWSYIGECARAAAGRVSVFGNGDVFGWKDVVKAWGEEPEDVEKVEQEREKMMEAEVTEMDKGEEKRDRNESERVREAREEMDEKEGDLRATRAIRHRLGFVDSVVIGRGALIKPWLFKEIKEKRDIDISSSERFGLLKHFVDEGMMHWGADSQGVELTRSFLLEWLSFLFRYVPCGIIDRREASDDGKGKGKEERQILNVRYPRYKGRDELETLMASDRASDWIKLSEMLLGKTSEGFQFAPKHRSNSY
ncbi:putative CCCH-type zinc finger-containing protein [Monocercomonoides exilis]|uniref:putative CCCH-type zinc finger-containing protein n=1 Tax=Monocercomonoides exilis TaxID=2049356 RepID=UPI003559C6A1|nr:putative CCCH-type zinc finger-containing protein [Monocercomonoides exilis]|eukprot:MONOS_9639.1-p1 / transcript=MONOS_9639.1 / gene=MONOS_9639 / organism=Monocercomonoides_exilis_PA203 / gene_product=CCCH-type zinc finger-containing protein / transcript_product=CCCH-type zinc finger-containing protein / location=Mono_scaffold00404:50384-53011(+) / protein_length=875 / sequence_SO=supercontig / SO=protein_coding / is_pseudo=false